MERRNDYTIALVLALGCFSEACQSSSSISQRNAVCEVEIRYPKTYSNVPPMEGSLSRLGVIIKNTSDRYLMLTRLVPRDPMENEYAWQFDTEGELQFVLQQDRYLLRTKPWSSTPPYFNNGLLAPGEKISLPLKTRTLHLPRSFTLEYIVLTPDQMWNLVYVPVPSEIPDEIAYQKTRGPLPGEAAANPEFPGPTLRTVIAPPSILFQTEKLVLSVGFPYDPNPFPADLAMKAVGAPPSSAHTYFEGGQGWIIQSSPKEWWFAGEQASARIPALPWNAFFLFDISEKPVEVEFADGTHADFAGEYRMLTVRDFSGRPRYVLYLDRESILTLLISLGKRNLHCDFSTQYRLPRLTIKRGT